jgi:branched-chain amino acid transport system permease protein
MEWLSKYDGINGISALELFGWILDSSRSIDYLISMVVLATVVSVQNLLNSLARTCHPRVVLRRDDG